MIIHCGGAFRPGRVGELGLISTHGPPPLLQRCLRYLVQDVVLLEPALVRDYLPADLILLLVQTAVDDPRRSHPVIALLVRFVRERVVRFQGDVSETCFALLDKRIFVPSCEIERGRTSCGRVRVLDFSLCLPCKSYRPIGWLFNRPIGYHTSARALDPTNAHILVEFDPGMVGKCVRTCYMTSLRKRSIRRTSLLCNVPPWGSEKRKKRGLKEGRNTGWRE